MASFAVLAAAVWMLGVTLSGSLMGWGGRSDGQIVLFVTLIVLLPFGLTTAAALRAVVLVQDGSIARGFLFGLLALTPLPLAFGLESLQVLPF